MSWSMDHVAICAHDIEASTSFYEDVFGMVTTQLKLTPHPDQPIQPGQFAHILDPTGSSLHLINPTPNFFVKYKKQNQNPTEPHIAITVDSLETVKGKLKEREWLFEAPQEWGPTGYVRLYTDEHFLNIFEPNEKVNETAETGAAAAAKSAALFDDGRAKWWLDHACVPSLDVRRTADWIAHSLGLTETSLPADAGVDTDQFAFFPEDDGSGRLGVHVADPELLEWEQAGPVNPYDRGHFAVAVEDLDAVKAALDARGSRWEPGPEPAAPGREAIYTRDPSRNVVEISPRG
jgi:catechol 2,3-dioxygenase-like lactoylglutathione lyase family enzyme